MLDVAVRGARVVRGQEVETADIGIEGGVFAAFGADVGAARHEIDAEGAIALPGIVDAHVHVNEPGRTDWEGFATGSAAHAAGGGTTFLDMPLNSEPPLLDATAFHLKRAAAEASSVVDVGLWGGLTPDNVERLEPLADAGVVGFKAFLSDSGIASFRAADDATLWRGMRVAAARGLVVAVHAENDAITRHMAGEIRRSGRRDAAAWRDSRPPVAETEAIGRALALAEDTGARLHVVHVSTLRGAELVAEARARGVDATGETCPHYLHFTTEDAARIGIALKCAPPVRGADERAGLWAALRSGRLDFVASDHSPAPPDLKTGTDWFEAWGGVAGVQSTLAVLLEHHERGELTLPDVARLTSTAPARRFGLTRKGRLEPGADADLVLVRRSATPRALAATDLRQRHAVSPYVGEAFSWRVTRTIRRGETIASDGTITAQTHGRLVRPTAHAATSAARPPQKPRGGDR